jgi:tRNA(fMet)-specific endonuclease VapC
MMFLLDTDHISILQKQSGREYTALMARIAQVPRSDLAFCIVSFHEQVLGCNDYISQARTVTDIVRGYRMFDRVLIEQAPRKPWSDRDRKPTMG